MTHRTVFLDQLPTLALVSLGASEALVGLQRGFAYLAVLLQLPTLRLVSRHPKRSILIAGQLLALVGALPLVFFGALEAQGGALALGVALAGFAVAAAGLGIADTAWFPLLHGYQESGQTGRFFAWLRTGWHVALIVYFLAAQRWLAAHPGAFGPLFAVGFAAGVARIAFLLRFPERSERSGAPIRAREALRLLASQPLLRRYLAGTALGGAARGVATTFALVMLRRVVGMSEGQVLFTTVAIYAGGLASLWIAGRIVDAVGPEPVFRWTAFGLAAVVLGLSAVVRADSAGLALAIALFFGLAALGSAFDVADTDVLFRLAPDDAPARTVVAAQVVDSSVRALVPLAVGIALHRALAAGVEPFVAYRVVFAACAASIALAVLPLRAFRGRPRSVPSS